MNKRQLRHETIRRIIGEQRVFTQQEMTQLLNEAGFDCTQATVSRDIVELGLEKSAGKFYVLPEEVRLRRMVPQMVKDVRAAGNLVVVKTLPGSAGSVAQALDSAAFPEVIGTVAGDDTILLVVETPEVAQVVEANISNYR